MKETFPNSLENCALKYTRTFRQNIINEFLFGFHNQFT